MFYDSNNGYVLSETGKYITNTNPQYKDMYVERKANLTICNFSRVTTTGNFGSWCIKNMSYAKGVQVNLGNITRITMNTQDYEPAGTIIKIYGQRAY